MARKKEVMVCRFFIEGLTDEFFSSIKKNTMNCGLCDNYKLGKCSIEKKMIGAYEESFADTVFISNDIVGSSRGKL